VSRPSQTSKCKGPREGPRARKAVPTAEQLQASQKNFQNFSKIPSYVPRAGGAT
jgi:hypothetical protein